MVKKTTKTKSTGKVVAQKSAKTTSAKPKKRSVPHLYREANPDRHNISGKYTFLYIFFALAMLIFALTTIYLYSVTHDIVRRYDDFIRYSKENSLKYEGGEDNE